MIQLTQEEVWVSNILNNSIQQMQAELQRNVAAQSAFIKLLENKYKAMFDPESGQLKPKKEK